jgi:hypothetical protein
MPVALSSLQRRPAGAGELRPGGLAGINSDGGRKARRLTPLGWSLLLRSAGPA